MNEKNEERGLWKSIRDMMLDIFVIGILAKGILDIAFPRWTSYLSSYYQSYQSKTWNQLAPAIAQYDGKPGISFEDQLKFAEVVGILDYDIVEGKAIQPNNLSFSQLERALVAYSFNVPQE